MSAFVSQFKIAVLSIFAVLPISGNVHPVDTGFIPSPMATKPGFSKQGSGYAVKLTPNEAVIRTTSTFRIKWLNANSRPRVVGHRVLRGRANFFLGNDPAQW